MPDSLNAFLRRGGRLTAFDLACAENPEAWNTWRQQSDMFGDHANLRIDLSRLNLGGRNLTGYNLVNVSFQRSGLNGTILRSVDCAYSDFYEANLIGADLSRANLKNAKLGRAFLRDANFSRADLRGADLRRASLTSASLLGANICGVDLSNSRGLEQQQLEDAIGDRRTRIPQHLQMPAAWAIYDAEPPPETGELGKLVILPASVEIAVISGRVQLSSSPGMAFFASSADPEILLAEIIEDLNRVKVRCSNSGELSHAIEKYLNESEKKNYDVILLGVRGIKIQEIFGVMVEDRESSERELLPDVEGALRAILIQHQLFISQFHQWRKFLDGVAASPFDASDLGLAKRAVSQVGRALEAHPDACDSRVPEALSAVGADLTNPGSLIKLAIFNAFSSVENALRGITNWLVKEARRFLGEAWDSLRSNLAKIAGTGMAALIISVFAEPVVSEMAKKHPARFAYIRHITTLLKEEKDVVEHH